MERNEDLEITIFSSVTKHAEESETICLKYQKEITVIPECDTQ